MKNTDSGILPFADTGSKYTPPERPVEKVLEHLTAIERKLDAISAFIGMNDEEEEVKPKTERVYSLEEPVLEVLADGKIWAAQAVAEALIEKGGLVFSAHNLPRVLNRMANLGKITKVARNVYRLNPPADAE